MENKEMQVVDRASQGLVDKMKDQSLSFFNPTAWEGINLMAKTFHQAGALPKSLDTAPKVVMALQAGKEAGMQPMEALQAFAPINGKMTMYGDALIAQVAKAGHNIMWGKCNKTEATVTIKRIDNKKEMTETWTIEDAKEAEIYKNVWLNHPRRMLKYKAFAEVAHFLVPDALKGVIVREFADEYEPVVEEKKELPKTKPTTVTAEVVSTTGSLDEAIDKEPEIEEMPQEAPKRLKQDVIKDIENLSVEKNIPVKEICDKYKKASLDKFKVDELMVVEESLEGSQVREVEQKTTQPTGNGKWPGDVCRYLKFIDGINDQDLPADILILKDDAKTGTFKGMEFYPSLADQIKSVPQDFN